MFSFYDIFQQKVCMRFFSPMHSTCEIYIKLLSLTTLTILNKENSLAVLSIFFTFHRSKYSPRNIISKTTRPRQLAYDSIKEFCDRLIDSQIFNNSVSSAKFTVILSSWMMNMQGSGKMRSWPCIRLDRWWITSVRTDGNSVESRTAYFQLLCPS